MSNFGQSASGRRIEKIVIGLIVTVVGGLMLSGIHSWFGLPMVPGGPVGSLQVSESPLTSDSSTDEIGYVQGSLPRTAQNETEASIDTEFELPESVLTSEVYPFGGTYHGVAFQDSKSSKTWEVEVSFSGQGGTIEYRLHNPSRKCGGTLTERPDGLWLELITQGTCDNGGTWFFSQPTSDSLLGEYQPPVGSYRVTADLYRIEG